MIALVCTPSIKNSWVNRFAVQTFSFFPRLIVALFLDSSIQNVHQVYKARYILSECLSLLFIFKKNSRFCAVSSCSSLLWFLLRSNSPLQRAITLDRRLLLHGHLRLMTRMSTKHHPFSPSYGVSSNFSLQYVNPIFNSDFAIRNNVDVLAGSLTLVPSAVLPGYVTHSRYVCFVSDLPPSTYVLQAFNIANNSDIYSSTAPFTIGAATSTTGSSSSTGSTPSTATSNGASTSKLT